MTNYNHLKPFTCPCCKNKLPYSTLFSLKNRNWEIQCSNCNTFLIATNKNLWVAGFSIGLISSILSYKFFRSIIGYSIIQTLMSALLVCMIIILFYTIILIRTTKYTINQ